MRAFILRRGFALACATLLLGWGGCVTSTINSMIVHYVGIPISYPECLARYVADATERVQLAKTLGDPALSAETKRQQTEAFDARHVARIRSALVLNPGASDTYLSAQLAENHQEWEIFVAVPGPSLERSQAAQTALRARQASVVKEVFAEHPERYESYVRKQEAGLKAGQVLRHRLELRRQAVAATALAKAQAAQVLAPPNDSVLWHYRVGVMALREGNLGLAREQFDAALARTGGLLSTVGAGAEARRLFVEESKKGFVGEPYERVMASFYRGLIYWIDGEPDNARALFRNGAFIDSDTTDKAYAADWVSLDYLDGLATHRLSGGETGGDALARARSNYLGQTPSLESTLPAYTVASNVLVVVEYGSAPMKYASGEYQEKLMFVRGDPVPRSWILAESVATGIIKAEDAFLYQAGVLQMTRLAPVGWVRLEVDGRTIELPALDDLHFQASTRGGRAMDYVLGNKAVYKKTGSTAGDVAMAGGIGAMAGGGNNMVVGLGLLAVGATAKSITRAIKTEADTRMWDNLPETIGIAQLQLLPGEHAARLLVYSKLGRLIEERTQAFTITVPPPAPETDHGTHGVVRDVIVFRSDVVN